MVRVCSKVLEVCRIKLHVALDQCIPRVYGVKRRTQRLKDQVITVKTKDKRVKPLGVAMARPQG